MRTLVDILSKKVECTNCNKLKRCKWARSGGVICSEYRVVEE